MSRMQKVGLLMFIAGAAHTNGGNPDIQDWARLASALGACIGAVLFLVRSPSEGGDK